MYIAITSVEFIKYSRAWMGMLFRSMECEWKEKEERKTRRLFFLVAHARHDYYTVEMKDVRIYDDVR